MNAKQIIEQVNQDAAAQGLPPLIQFKQTKEAMPNVDSTRFAASITTVDGRTEYFASCEVTGEVSAATERAIERRTLAQALGSLLFGVLKK